MKHTFIINDESVVNSHGFRVLNSAIDQTAFLKNPIGFYNHNRDEKENGLPICKWSNLRIEGSKMLADAEFDQEDEFALKIEKKVEQGIISATSLGIFPLSTSDDIDVMLQGQTLPTLIEGVLKEISVVDIPSNANCVTLYEQNGSVINLSDNSVNNHLFNSTMNFNLKEANKIIGLSESASLEQYNQKLQDIMSENLTLASVKKENEELKAAEQVRQKLEEDNRKKAAEEMVQLAVDAGKIKIDAKEQWVQLAEVNFDATKTAIDSMSEYKPVTSGLQKGENQELSFNGKKFHELSNSELVELKTKSPEDYAKLRKQALGK